jgi:hypothetical protein
MNTCENFLVFFKSGVDCWHYILWEILASHFTDFTMFYSLYISIIDLKSLSYIRIILFLEAVSVF